MGRKLMNRHWKNSLYIFLLSLSLYLGLCLQAYHAGNMRLLNFGLLHQLIWNTLHGNFYWSSVHNCNGLGVHFNIILLSVIPLYLLIPSGYALITMQAILFTLASVGVYHLAFTMCENEKEALLWGVLSAIFPPIVVNCALGLQDLHFSLPTAIWLLYFLERRRYVAVTLLTLLLFLNKEEFFLWGIFFGLYLIIFHKRVLHGSIVVVVSLLLFTIIEFFVMPSFVRGHGLSHHFFKYSFGHFGKNPGEMLAGLSHTWHYLFIPPLLMSKLLHLLTILSFFFFLPLGRARYLFFIIPSFYLYYISMRDVELNPKYYYVMTLLPYLFASAICMYATLSPRAKKAVWIGLFIVALSFDAYYYHSEFLIKDYISNKPLEDKVVQNLPPDASIAVDEFTGGYDVVKRKKVQLFRFFFARPDLFGDYEYILLNMKYCRIGLPEHIYWEEIGFVNELISKGSYTVIYSEDEVLLLKKR